MKIRSAHMKSPWQFKVREVTLPDTPPAGWVLVRIEAAGICGSDLTSADHGAKEWGAFGHEIAGALEALGPGVEGLSVGQRVVLESASFCGRCDLCRNGRTDLCNKAPGFWGQDAMGFADIMLAPACCIVPYEGLTPEVASLTEPAGVSYDMVKVAGIQVGDRVCVVGPGPIGLMAAAIARSAGAIRVVCIGHSHSEKRLATARELGAEAVACDGSIEDLKDLAGQFDHALVTAQAPVIPSALSLLAYEGKLTYIGAGRKGSTISIDANNFHGRKLQLRASFASPAAYFPRVLSLMKAGIIQGEKIISHTFRLADIEKAMLTARDDKRGTVKVVVKP